MTLRSIILATALTLGASGAFAHSYKQGDIEIGHPWSRATAASAPTGAAFLTLTETGAQPDRLISASTPAAEKAELHTHIKDNGVMRMRQVPSIELEPGKTVALQPGGYHIMMIGLKKPLAKGDHVPLTLTFEKAGTITVELHVEGAGAMTGMEAGHGGMDHSMKGMEHKTN